MKRSVCCLVVVVSILLLAAEDVFARGARGGGGGGGMRAGGARPSVSRSPSINRSPSMSRTPSYSRPSAGRPTTRPSVPSRPATRPTTPSRPGTQPIQRPGARPGVGQPGTRPGVGQPIQRPGTRPGIAQPGTRPGVGQPGGQRPSRGDLQQFLKLPTDRPGTRPSPGQLPSPGQRPATGQRPGVGQRPAIGQRPAGIGRPAPVDRANLRNRQINVNRTQINRQINNRYRNVQNRPFTRGWRPPHAAHLPARSWHHWRHWARFPQYRPGHWWRWATAAAVTRWVAYRWSRPVYYGYGSGGNVYYENNVVYVDGQEYCSADQYYEQATAIAGSVPEISEAQAEQIEWLPLGVFALTQEGVDATNMLLQLAVTKEGIIAGTLFNETTGLERPVEGMVDRETQRAAWSPADGKNADVVMETGIYNLTENEVTALVHFGKERTQTWVMIRLDQPEEQQQQPAAPAPATAARRQ